MSKELDRPRVLDIGSGPDSIARKYWPDAQIFTLDADPATTPDIVGTMAHIPRPDNTFDKILASHVLEHIEYRDVRENVKEMARVLKAGGELHIFVPSLEWAARQILSERPSPITIMTLYGLQSTPWQYHKSGFTMLSLRQLLVDCGMSVAIARRAIYHVTGTNGKGEPIAIPTEQHYVVGVKNAEGEK